MPNKRIGIGIIGTGFGATVQLPGFLSISDAEVIGVASRNSRRAQEFATMHNLPQTFASPEELIASPDIDLVSVATPQATHKEFAEAVIAAGKALLCEKPLTLTAKDAQMLLEKAQAADIVHATDFEFRELPAWQLLHQRIKNGSIGNIKSAKLNWITGSWSNPARPWGWQCDETVGGGIISALGVHLFDAAEWLVGSASSLKATTKIKIAERPDAHGSMKKVTAEDTADIEMKTTNDVPVSIGLSNVAPSEPGVLIQIDGDKGTLLLQSTSKDYGRSFRLTENGKILMEDETIYEGDARIPPFTKLAIRLIKAVREHDTGFSPSLMEGVRTQMIREAVLQANKTGNWVNI
jgi:predicted dehydrogenase